MSLYTKVLDLLNKYRDRHFRLNMIAKDNYITDEDKTISELGDDFNTLTKLTTGRSPESISTEFPLGYQTIHNDGSRVNGNGLAYGFSIFNYDVPPSIDDLDSDMIFKYVEYADPTLSNTSGQGGTKILSNTPYFNNSLYITDNATGIDKNAIYNLPNNSGPKHHEPIPISSDAGTGEPIMMNLVTALAYKNYVCWNNFYSKQINCGTMDGIIITTNYWPGDNSTNIYDYVVSMSPGNDSEVYILFRINKDSSPYNSYSIMKYNAYQTSASDGILSETIIENCNYCSSEIKYDEVRDIVGTTDGCYIGLYLKNSPVGFIYITENGHAVYNNERCPISTGNYNITYSPSNKRINIYNDSLSSLGYLNFTYVVIDYYGDDDKLYVIYENNDKYFLRKYTINSPVSTTAELIVEWTTHIDLPLYRFKHKENQSILLLSFDNDNVYVSYNILTYIINKTSGKIIDCLSNRIISIGESKYINASVSYDYQLYELMDTSSTIYYDVIKSLGGYLLKADNILYSSQNLIDWNYIGNTYFHLYNFVFMDNNGFIYIATDDGYDRAFIDVYSIDGIYITRLYLDDRSIYNGAYFICRDKERTSYVDVYFINGNNHYHITNTDESKVNKSTSVEVPKLIRGTSVISNNMIQLLNLDFIPEKAIIIINDYIVIEASHGLNIKSSDSDIVSINTIGVNGNNIIIGVPEKYNGFNYTYSIFGRYCKSE